MHRATIKDIAKILGISPSTVSRALKDHPDISEKTKKAVLEQASKLKYRPNTLALNLRKNKSNTIGVIIPQIVHYFFSSVISGIEDCAHEKGYTVIVTQSNELVEREIDNTTAMISSGVEGVLISRTKQTTDFSHFTQLMSYDIPIVFFDRICPTLKTDKVIVNDEYAAFLATEYLIKTGCRKIVHFKGPDNLEISTKRLTGFLEAFHEYNLPYEKDLIITCDNFEEAIVQTQKLIDNKITFDGIFTVNDDSAAGAIVTLNKNRISIPDQVSVFGYSNDLISKIISPKLSTVEQPGYEMGYTATRLLIERIESEKEIRPRTEVVSTKLVLRESTKTLV
ncbi:MAG: LacI family DNA-binding transcriptional regulator [Bacteroidales bacterium]|nr:LacI family DNA-binding transcriptional regulator [Bacteroidales bacterium]